MFCQVCHAMSHVTNDCWELEKNSLSRPSTWQSKLVDEEFDEFNEELIVSASAECGEEELQDQCHDEGTADQTITSVMKIYGILLGYGVIV